MLIAVASECTNSKVRAISIGGDKYLYEGLMDSDYPHAVVMKHKDDLQKNASLCRDEDLRIFLESLLKRSDVKLLRITCEGNVEVQLFKNGMGKELPRCELRPPPMAILA